MPGLLSPGPDPFFLLFFPGTGAVCGDADCRFRKRACLLRSASATSRRRRCCCSGGLKLLYDSRLRFGRLRGEREGPP